MSDHDVRDIVILQEYGSRNICVKYTNADINPIRNMLHIHTCHIVTRHTSTSTTSVITCVVKSTVSGEPQRLTEHITSIHE